MFHFLREQIFSVLFVVVLIQLLISLYVDLKTAKVPNKLNVSFLFINLVLILALRGGSGVALGLASFGIAFALLIPTFLLKILGGGDVKLMLAVSPVLLLDELVGFIFMSLAWGGIFGLVSSTMQGNLRSLLTNTLLAGKRVTKAESKIPFTFGILLGWLSYKSFLALGVL